MTHDPTVETRLQIRESAARADWTPLKVALPTDLRIRLHAHKLLTGEQIGSTVAAALTAYFLTLENGPAGDGA